MYAEIVLDRSARRSATDEITVLEHLLVYEIKDPS